MTPQEFNKSISSFFFYECSWRSNFEDLKFTFSKNRMMLYSGIGNDPTMGFDMSIKLYNYLQAVHAFHWSIISAFEGDKRSKQKALVDTNEFKGYESYANGFKVSELHKLVCEIRNVFHHRKWINLRYWTRGESNIIMISPDTIGLKKGSALRSLVEAHHERNGIESILGEHFSLFNSAIIPLKAHICTKTTNPFYWQNEFP